MNIIGERVDLDGSKGLIKFYGEIAGTSGQWVGIDWDNLKRGKHNGTLNGVQYFMARGDTSGSFVRLEVLNFGVDLIEALQEKYADGNIKEDSAEKKDPRWQFIEMDKIHKIQSDIYRLRTIVLSNSLVSHLNRNSLVEKTFKYCTELDLTNSLIGRWTKLIQILDCFPFLHMLHLSGNRMEPLELLENFSLLQKNPTIKAISMNNCFLTEESANLITSVFVNLEEIYLAFNQLKFFNPLENCEKLRKVDLQDNLIGKFVNISKLSRLPRLEFLNLSNCQIDLIDFASNGDIGFNSLQTLFIQNNPIKKWSCVEQLARLKSLQKLVIRGAPLAGARGVDTREILISKLPNLIDLDRCDVSAVARRSAELLFLSRFGQLPMDLEHQATISRLETVYGPIDRTAANSSPAKNNCGLNTLRLWLVYGEKRIQHDLPQILPIHKIVGLAARLLDFDPLDDLSAVELKRTKDLPSEILKRTTDNLLAQFDLEVDDTIEFLKNS